MAILLSIPNEIQLKIAAKLNYPDLHQMRLTCKYLYNLPTNSFLKNALLKLEMDFCESDTLAAAISSTYEQVYVDHLVTIGYLSTEMVKFRDYRICHQCSSIMRLSEFPKCQVGTYLRYCEHWERRCGKCYMASAEYLAGRNRWLEFPGPVASIPQRRMICKSCGELREYAFEEFGTPVVYQWSRQLYHGKCKECWIADNESWMLSRKQLQEERDELQQKANSLDRYIGWMDEVEYCYPEGEDERWEHLQPREPRQTLEVSQYHVPQWHKPPA